MGAAYYIRAGVELSSDVGVLTVSSGIDKNRLDEISAAIIGELKKMATDKVSEEELSKAKEHLSGRLILQLETSDELAGFYGSDELVYGSERTPEEIIANYQKVTADDILNLAKDLMKNERLNFSAIGQFGTDTEQKLSEIIKF